jgi:hypothetical protein
MEMNEVKKSAAESSVPLDQDEDKVPDEKEEPKDPAEQDPRAKKVPSSRCICSAAFAVWSLGFVLRFSSRIVLSL